jgi:hypothetical protein
MDNHTKACIVDFATRSFRDIADHDYICARSCHRLGLEQQFLWAALQAIEKYIKGILLFNFRSTKGYSHRVKDAYDALSSIPDIPFQIPKDVVGFITYLDEQGANRYFTYPYYTRGDNLFLLDKSVWHLRRYCQRLHLESVMPDGKKKQHLNAVLNTIHSPRFEKAPNKFRISSGVLDKIVDGKPTLVRRELVWKNFYFGKRTKHFVSKFVMRSSSGNPTHFLHKGAFAELNELVRFEKPVCEYFKGLAASAASTPAPRASQKSPA